jgi:hypothetical protein
MTCIWAILLTLLNLSSMSPSLLQLAPFSSLFYMSLHCVVISSIICTMFASLSYFCLWFQCWCRFVNMWYQQCVLNFSSVIFSSHNKPTFLCNYDMVLLILEVGRCKLRWLTFVTKRCFFLGYPLFKCTWWSIYPYIYNLDLN